MRSVLAIVVGVNPSRGRNATLPTLIAELPKIGEPGIFFREEFFYQNVQCDLDCFQNVRNNEWFNVHEPGLRQPFSVFTDELPNN